MPSSYLTEGWPLGPTSTIYADGSALFNVRQYGKVGVLATVDLTYAQAQIIRDVVHQRIRTTESRVIGNLVREWDDGGRLDAAIRGLSFEEWVRTRADSVEIEVVEDDAYTYESDGRSALGGVPGTGNG
jgi:hypothetical protein